MAYQNLHDFLVTVSKHASMRTTLKKGGAEAEKLMSEAGLTAREKALVRQRDKKAIKAYLGDAYAAAAMINLQ
jgi:molybdopterin biosynthesis enzyme MoaB